MGMMARLFGRQDEPQQEQPLQRRNTIGSQPAGQLTDEQAVARYRYMLQTAPPETIEQAHAEAFIVQFLLAQAIKGVEKRGASRSLQVEAKTEL